MAFDTSAAHCAAALLMGGQVVAERYEGMKKGQAERLFPMLEALLHDASISWNDLTAIGVGIGPGNFTGIRIALSAARGLALSLGIPAVGVSTFQAYHRHAGSPAGLTLVIAPGPRNQVYKTLFQENSPDAPELIAQDELERPPWAVHLAHVIGPDDEDATTHAVAHRLPVTGSPSDAPPVTVVPPSSVAVAIAEVASDVIKLGDPVAPPSPLYIRPPDAAPSSDPPPVILP